MKYSNNNVTLAKELSTTENTNPGGVSTLKRTSAKTKADYNNKKNVHYTSAFSVWAGLTQSRRCSSQSLRWCSAEQYLTSLHLLQTCPRPAGRAASTLPFPLAEEHSLPSPTGAFSENATSQSIQLHISRARTRRNDPGLRPRFSGSTAAPSRPFRGNLIISQSSVQHGLGHPEGKSKNMSAAGTKSGCVKKIWE